MNASTFRLYRAEDNSSFLAKITIIVPDRPGSLAELASAFARYDANIILFHYNRSEHQNRVLLEVACESMESLGAACKEAIANSAAASEMLSSGLELGLLDTANILRIDVHLDHKPGTLGEFAVLLKMHNANVINMEYNEDVSAVSALFSIVTETPSEIDLLLRDMNQHGYHYSLLYKGSDRQEVEHIIGLNLAERFFFKLKKLLNTADIERMKKLFSSSRLLSDTLVQFNNEAGRDLEAGNIFTNVLAFASASLMKAADQFSFTALAVIERSGIKVHSFRLPTGGNVFILEGKNELVMIDGGYGLYYEKAKDMFRSRGLDPARIKRIYISHADADHAGMSGLFANEFGCSVWMHPEAEGIIKSHNRAWGSSTPYIDLNRYFTVLVNEFTQASFPERWNAFKKTGNEYAGGFEVVDEFSVDGITFSVLVSLGGHLRGQVFFLSKEAGLFFTADYLLNVGSLPAEEREVLSFPKFMMISTNVDSALFRQEMDMLRKFALDFDAELRSRGSSLIIAPGHGDYYEASALNT
ncbi:MAG: MBL fold metallo-hydrolase [Nitrospiraceae bacterium]|nr:MBL fold metallo-hydrolase [Nitrospiraceae bacterium]